jgi:natural product biosynthesis luciferase-like monooxygenase protein
MDLSLFYFADDAGNRGSHRYRLLLEGARFADRHGFAAVWTPERHFHRFGGNYPNPSVTSAALAVITERVAIRAGSVVAPLHHVLRIAEEWAVVDELSGGRAGLSLASGWNERDFVLRPEGYEHRRNSVLESVEALRRLWRGERLDGGPQAPQSFPTLERPLPLWLTAAGSPETFRAAGTLGVGILTHLANQDLAALRLRIAEYRAEFQRAGHAGRGHIVLMLHTFLDPDPEVVESSATGPLSDYLASAMTLMRPDSQPPGGWSQERLRAAVRPTVYRYLHQGLGLFGTVGTATALVRDFARAGVDEIACLIDFGISADAVLRSLSHLDELRHAVADTPGGAASAVPPTDSEETSRV